ncbi:MAG: quinolinate synthase NadA [Bacteroidota bacterium]
MTTSNTNTANNQVDYIAEIKRLKKEKNAVILAHYYQIPEIQELGDYVGDSLQLAQIAAKVDADMIVFCGVHFMAETAKILNPSKKVVLPDMEAGCSLAESCPIEEFKPFVEKHPDHTVITYVNASAAVKTVTDLVVTSSNAESLINQLPKDEKIIFGPDRNLGAYINKKTGRDMILWDGSCEVHEAFSLEKITELMKEHPGAELIAHPESEAPVLNVADFIGSTAKLIEYVKTAKAKEFIVATEMGILHEMRKVAPGKILIPVPVKDDYKCNCSECTYMKMNTIEKLYSCMKNETPEIHLDQEVIDKSLPSINRMLEMSK